MVPIEFEYSRSKKYMAEADKKSGTIYLQKGDAAPNSYL